MATELNYPGGPARAGYYRDYRSHVAGLLERSGPTVLLSIHVDDAQVAAVRAEFVAAFEDVIGSPVAAQWKSFKLYQCTHVLHTLVFYPLESLTITDSWRRVHSI